MSENNEKRYSIAKTASLQKDQIRRRCLPDGRAIQWRVENNTARLNIADTNELILDLHPEHRSGPSGVSITIISRSHAPVHLINFLAALYCIFDASPECRSIVFDLSEYPELATSLREYGIARIASVNNAKILECQRELLWQQPQLWMNAVPAAPYPLQYEVTNNQRHPIRPAIPSGTIYRRFIPALDKVISFRTIAIDRDLEIFHRWMNIPRVAYFWELQGSKDEHAEYLQTVLQDAHLHPLIGCFDDQPFGYFEAYWAKEDRIAPFYQADDYDRGLHMLVGEENFRGPQYVSAWLQSLVHCLFLADPRTRNVVLEPRADNAKMIAYLQAAGFHKMKEFDFPHKRAAMMLISREVYFDQFCP